MRNYILLRVEEGELDQVRLDLHGQDSMTLELSPTVSIDFKDRRRALAHLKHLVRVAEAILDEREAEEPAALGVNGHG
jgi:hypothetical protein